MSEHSFTLGLTYWPRRTASSWWAGFDRGAVDEELAHIAALGFDQVRLLLRWEDVQPGPQRINGTVLSAFERALEAVASARLRAVVGLFPAALGGGLHVPRWVAHANALDELRQVTRFGAPLVVSAVPQQQVIYEGAYHSYDLRDPFRDPSLLAAQRYQVREVVGYFGSHPAIAAWQVGEGLERLRKPDSAEAVRDWFRSLSEAVDQARRGAPTLAVCSTRALQLSAGPRPELLASCCTQVGVSVEAPPDPAADRPLDPSAVQFLYTLASSLAERPLAVLGLGQPTAPDGRAGWTTEQLYGASRRVYLAHPQEQAEFVGTALGQLYAAGAPGVWLASYADYPPDLWRVPPLDRTVGPRTQGLVDQAGREKPVAAAVRAFAAQVRTERPPAQPAQPATPDGRPAQSAPEAPATPAPAQPAPAAPASQPARRFSALPLDPERYWRNPQRELEALWREFVR
jgi:hypothetical protein